MDQRLITFTDLRKMRSLDPDGFSELDLSVLGLFAL